MKAEGRGANESRQPCAIIAQGKTRVRAAALTGYSHTTLDKAEAVGCGGGRASAVRQAGREHGPDGNVDRAFKFLKAARGREAYEQRQHQGGTVKDLPGARSLRLPCVRYSRRSAMGIQGVERPGQRMVSGGRSLRHDAARQDQVAAGPRIGRRRLHAVSVDDLADPLRGGRTYPGVGLHLQHGGFRLRQAE